MPYLYGAPVGRDFFLPLSRISAVEISSILFLLSFSCAAKRCRIYFCRFVIFNARVSVFFMGGDLLCDLSTGGLGLFFLLFPLTDGGRGGAGFLCVYVVCVVMAAAGP